MSFIPTRAVGLSRLNDFIPQAGRDYSKMRNSDLGAGKHDHVSALSPYLRHRLITEREVIDATLKHHRADESDKFVQEVFWRSYFKGWLEHRPQVYTRYQSGVQVGLKALHKDNALQTDYEEAISGETGIECFDYWVNELIETGYLHNHSRMWFASIWIFTLRLPWELGADFFLRNLIDGDPASNTLSWRWVGGLHTKGKTYLARPDNIARFTHGRFNPQGQVAAQAEPLTEQEDLLPDQTLPQSGSLPTEPFLLLIHEDDCHPRSLLPENISPNGVIGALATARRSTLDVNKKVSAFARAAIEDALSNSGSVAPPIDGDWALGLVAKCEKYNVKRIVTGYLPIGPSAQVLSEAMPEIERHGIKISQILRPWDQFTWPHANRGFFKLKNKIPRILEDLKEGGRGR